MAVSGGKRLNFDRREPYGDRLTDTFIGEGKAEGTCPSGSWDELCAFAKLIVEHPAYREPVGLDPLHPPRIEDS